MTTADGQVGLVFVHGFMSSPRIWSAAAELIRQDPELDFATPLLFRYSSPRFRIHPLRTVPTFEVIADKLAGFIEVDAAAFRKLVLVTHSQGGLVVQRYLHRTLSDAEGLKLSRISGIVMFACPSAGSQLALSLRRSGLFGWNPQEPQLRPLNAAVTEALRTVVNRVVHASEAGPASWPIPIIAYAGEEDGVVPPASAHTVFPDRRVVSGDHRTLIRPKSEEDDRYRQLRASLLAARDRHGTTPLDAAPADASALVTPLRRVQREPHAPAARHRSLSAWDRYVLIEPEELIHVDKVIDDVTAAIEDPRATAASAVAVWGEGGLGKTAITHAAVQRVAKGDSFTHIVWASARNARFSAANATEASVNSMYWHDLLRIIAQQVDCELSPAQALWEGELRNHIEHQLDDARVLVVVDNLEYVDAADEVIEQLRSLGFRRPHRIVATTRLKSSGNEMGVRNMPIHPLGERETYNLVRLTAHDSSSDLAEARDEELESVYGITEGNPFLIKLITRRYAVSGLPLPRIIEELRQVTGELGAAVKAWLFEQSLEELARRSSRKEARRLLFSFCANGRGGAMTYEELFEESVHSDDVNRFNTLMTSACRLGLVRASGRDRRYSVHSLLYEHTCPRVGYGKSI
ncbi:NB-ARC domain-containing protein [Streptomyces acidiscabies]|uniref:NB-ARC domain-containing protein n=1 Tax=Streptomyces acidiscabies TaxID=42234 RepID=A0AAP6BJ13_9ACTN|nr:NB-ARC domain-containing protein [Streptomyces acidiscabies]MBP5935433.1 AAA family ATPase [Streptomyces sp. LBUM 1476]MBZ3916710.1 AAA family ATPase [Streptomyces acidiscabies]MDX2965653.1 NB-ARC domain-containing protein [Streptomyces acidiscabies]MDX3024845.1 NB-ARC domain-containing protein [Streptomyces acidiscabies]MDX3795569.1 NB-ARC domain-containing protein [Streptomyces acidiscabies]